MACRFDDTERAKALLPHGWGERLNEYSGKWNFHWHAEWSPEQCLEVFRHELGKVLSQPNMGRTTLAVAPSNPSVVYALAARNGGTFDQGLFAVFRSSDGTRMPS